MYGLQAEKSIIMVSLSCVTILASQKPFPFYSFHKVTRVQHIQMKTWNKTRRGLSHFQRRSIVDVNAAPAILIQVLGM